MKEKKAIHINKPIHKALKIYADYQDIKLNKLIENILDNWLKNEKKIKKIYLDLLKKSKKAKEIANEKENQKT